MNRLSNTSTYKHLKERLSSVFLWGTPVSLYHVLSIFFKKIITFDVDQRAAAVSYSFLLAVFPAFIFLFTLIPFIPIEHLDRQIMLFLKDVMPKGIYETAATTIHEIVSRKRSDILSFGFFFTVYAATNGMMALMRAFNMALHTRERRTFLKARIIAGFLTLLLILVMIAAIVLLIVGQIIIDFLHTKGFLGDTFNIYLLQIVRYASIFVIFYIGISVIYYFAPEFKDKFRFFNIGGIFSSIFCILATNLFSFYITNFNSYNKLYGSIGTLIALMVWIYLISLILILGFEINISIRVALSNEKEKTPQ